MREFRNLFVFLFMTTKLYATTNPILVDIQTINPTIIIDLFLADEHNFLGQALYPSNAKAYIHQEVAYQLDAIQKELATYGLGLKIKDAYRPFSVQKQLWEIALKMDISEPGNYVSDPQIEGGRHPRGIAIDVTLIHLDSQEELQMPPMGFIPEAHHGYMQNLSGEQIKNRDFLKSLMEKHGFASIRCEWWHYNLPNWKDYTPLDLSFDQLINS